jgi:hypothetical protein
MTEHLHQQTGLTTGTVADNDELAADLSHLEKAGEVSQRSTGQARQKHSQTARPARREE